GEICDIAYEVQENGMGVLFGVLEKISIPPHGKITVTIPLEETAGVTTGVLLHYLAKENIQCLEKGDSFGFDQLIFAEEKSEIPALLPGNPEIYMDQNKIYVTSANFSYIFNRHLGMFESMVKNNVNLLTRPMELNIYRAPIDNDMYVKSLWQRYGYDRKTVKVYESDSTVVDGIVQITCKLGIAAVYIKRFILVDAKWEIDETGKIRASLSCEKDEDFPFLPRFGLRLFLPKTFSGVEYLGYGPQESYEDKHRASYFGLFADEVENMHEDYIMPQENGSHWGCKFVTVADGATALTVTSPKPLSFSTSPYMQEELESKKHNYELEKCGDTVLCVDYRMSGVGSGACGPQLMEKYQMNETAFTFEFVLEIQ
ncbi:MAG: beta-galactosidase, partial [Oscillospiraceae bacterium]